MEKSRESKEVNIGFNATFLPDSHPNKHFSLKSVILDVKFEDLRDKACSQLSGLSDIENYVGIYIIVDDGDKRFFGMGNRNLSELLSHESYKNTRKNTKVIGKEQIERENSHSLNLSAELDLIIVPSNLSRFLKSNQQLFVLLFIKTIKSLIQYDKFSHYNFDTYIEYYLSNQEKIENNETAYISKKLEEFAKFVDSIDDFFSINSEANHLLLKRHINQTSLINFNNKCMLTIKDSVSQNSTIEFLNSRVDNSSLEIDLRQTYFLNIGYSNGQALLWFATFSNNNEAGDESCINNSVLLFNSFETANKLYTYIMLQCALQDSDFIQRVQEKTLENQDYLRAEYKQLVILSKTNSNNIKTDGVQRINKYLSVLSRVSSNADTQYQNVAYKDSNLLDNLEILGVHSYNKSAVTCFGAHKKLLVAIKSPLDQTKRNKKLYFEGSLLNYAANENIAELFFMRREAPTLLCFEFNHSITIDKFLVQMQKTDSKCIHRYSIQLMEVLKHLQKLHIVHRSIQKSNLFISAQSKLLKLFDFEKAKISLTNQFYDKSNDITLKATSAPESLLARVYSHRSDFWDGCITVLEMAYPDLVLFRNKKDAFEFYLDFFPQRFETLKNSLPVAFAFQSILSHLKYSISDRGSPSQLIKEIQTVIQEEKQVTKVEVIPKLTKVHTNAKLLLETLKSFQEKPDTRFIDFKDHIEEIIKLSKGLMQSYTKLAETDMTPIKSMINKLKIYFTSHFPKDIQNYEINKRNALSSQYKKRTIEHLKETISLLTNLIHSCLITVTSRQIIY